MVQPSSSACEPNFRLSSSADPFGAAFRPTCSLHRRSTFQPCLTDQTSDTGCCISGSASRSISDSRLRPTFPPGLRTQPPIPRRLHPFGAAFRPICGLRRRSTFQPCLTDPTSDSSALHLWRRFRSVFDLRLDQPLAAFGPISNFRWLPTFRLNLPVDLQLALRSTFRPPSDLVFGFRLDRSSGCLLV